MSASTDPSAHGSGFESFDADRPAYPPATFAEQALRMGGKSLDEARRIGTIDAADEQVERLFTAEYRTASSPLHQAVWDAHLALDRFRFPAKRAAERVQEVMRRSLDVVRERVDARTLYDDRGKISDDVLRDLADAGYWGLLVEPQYGGTNAPFAQFASFLTEMACLDPTVAGLASVHGCIGAVDPVTTFGTPEQKERFLPDLASGRRLSAFALTEPCAGSDMTALRTTAERMGRDYLVNGEKLFITNVLPGRTLALVCKIEDRPAVLVLELPSRENKHFRLKSYGLYALRRAHNYGLLFRDFRVPVENELQPRSGDGLTIAYHGLNRGRVSLCATAAGVMRRMLADTLPWARFRKTYGQPIGRRELVQRRLARLAGFIVACDALSQWCGHLLDRGFRGEMECIVAKVFASEVQKTASIDLYMKTHGGRSFLQGHPFGDNVHEFLAPCIYEGEGDILSLALFKSLVKDHAVRYFEPIGLRLQAAAISTPNLLHPRHVWLLRGPLWRYARWWTAQRLRRARRPSLPQVNSHLRAYAEQAADLLGRSALEISALMRKHQLRLADRQCRIVEISERLIAATVMLVTSLYASEQADETVRLAADCICAELSRELDGRRPSDRELRALADTGAALLENGFPGAADIPTSRFLMPYWD